MRRLRLTEQHGNWMMMSTLLALCSLLLVGLAVLPLFGPTVAALAAVAMLLGIFTACYLICMTGAMRVLIVLITAALLGLLPGAVLAHKGKLPDDTLTLVRQASALLAQNPGMTGEVRERLEAALKSKKTEGVRLELVAAALQALKQNDPAAARRYLAESTMAAGMPMPPEGVRVSTPRPAAQALVPPAPGPQPSVDLAMRSAEPLRAAYTGSRAEVGLLASAVVLIVLGLASLWRRREVTA